MSKASPFVEYERQVLRKLLRSHMRPEQIEELLDAASFVSYEHTGVGYFVTVRHAVVPHGRVVCSQPLIEGRGAGIECGFVAFLEAGELVLECHSWMRLPTDIRERPLAIRSAS